MATEVKRVITIETGEASKSIKDLKKEVEGYAVALAGLEEGTQQYEQTSQQLAEAQQTLDKAMSAVRGNLKAEEGSYAAISAEMAKLKKEWKQTGDTAKQAELAQKINALNDQLKGMDASVGVFSRNVGNYTGALAQYLPNISNGLNGIRSMMSMLFAHPLIALLAVLVMTIQKIVQVIRSNEEQLQGLKEAFSVVSGVMNTFLSVAQKLVGYIVDYLVESFNKLVSSVKAVANWIAKILPDGAFKQRLTGFFDDIADNADKARRAQEAENEAIRKNREATMRNAEDQLKVARLRREAMRATGAEAVRIYNEIDAVERRIMERNVEVAKLQYEAIKLRNDQAKSSTADLDAEAQAYARVVQAQTSYEQFMIRIEQRKASAQKQADANGVIDFTQIDAQIDAEQVQLERKLDEMIQKTSEKIRKDADMIVEFSLLQPLRQRLHEAQLGKDFEEIYQAQRAVAQAELDRLKQRLDDEVLSIEQKYQLRKAIAEKEWALEDMDAQHTEQWQQRRAKSFNTAIQIAQGAASIMGSISKMYQDTANDETKSQKEREKAFDNYKKQQIAQTLVSAFATAASTLYSIWSPKDNQLGTFARIALSATLVGANLASALAQVQNIRKQTLSSSGGSASGYTAPTVPTMGLDYVTNVRPNSETDTINTPIKAYVVDRDLVEGTHGYNQVQEATSF